MKLSNIYTTMALATLTLASSANAALGQTTSEVKIAQPKVQIITVKADEPEPTEQTEQVEVQSDDSLKADFNRLVRKRNTLHKQLQELDAKALRDVKNGEKPVDVYAEQISVQDKLDLTNLRLEMLSLRLDMEIPPLPKSEKEKAAEQAQDEDNQTVRISEFSRATDRTLGKLRSQTLQVLSSLDMTEFLSDNGRQ